MERSPWPQRSWWWTGQAGSSRTWGRTGPAIPTRTRDLLPVYKGAGKEAVKSENIDLDDPKKKVSQAFSGLIEEASADLMEAFKKAVGN